MKPNPFYTILITIMLITYALIAHITEQNITIDPNDELLQSLLDFNDESINDLLKNEEISLMLQNLNTRTQRSTTNE